MTKRVPRVVLVFAALLVAFLGFVVLFAVRGPRQPLPEVARAEKIRAFWKWFAKNQRQFAEDLRGPKGAKAAVFIVEESSRRLERLCPSVVGEVAMAEHDGDRPTLVISANGQRAEFPCVRDIVGAAPALQLWKVVAFRQRRPLDWEIELDGTRLAATQLGVREKGRHDGKVDVEVLIPGYAEAEEDEVFRALFPCLDALLGEEDVEAKLGVIELVAGQPSPDAGVPLLTELPAIVDSL
jgi:hypothetical protein